MPGRRRAVVAVRLLLRGLSHRRDIAALTLLGATIACAAAAVAPIYRSAAAVSALRARMVAAAPNDSGVEVAGTAWPGSGNPDSTLASQVPKLPHASPAITEISIAGRTTQLQVGKNGPIEFATLISRENECLHLHFVQGHCPTAADEMALSINSAQTLTASLGSPIVASALDQPDFGLPTDINDREPRLTPQQRKKVGTGKSTLDDHVVGIFTVPAADDSYWFGQDLTSPVINGDGTQLAHVNAIVARVGLTSLALPIRSSVVVDQPIDWSNATPAQAVQINQAIAALKAHTPSYRSVLTNVPVLLAADAKDRKQLNRLVTLAQIQLLLLVGLVLIAILAASMDRRRAELVIATLQGRRPIRTAFAIAAEPVLLLVVGLIPGLAISIPLGILGSHLWLRPGTPVHLTAGAVLAAVAVTAIAAVVTVIIGFVAASRPLNDQLAEDARSAGGRGGNWLDVVAITLAVAGMVELFATHTGTSSTPWSLLAPSLCGLAAGLLLGRIIPALLRPVIRRTAESRKIGRFLAIRELRRDRAAWRVTAIVALALSLLTFAVTVSRGAHTDRVDRAGLIVGAPKVINVSVKPSDTLLAAVDRADPSGTWAMAAEILAPFGSANLRTLAIDSPRLAAVAGWHRLIDGYTPKGLARILHVPDVAAKQRLPAMTAGGAAGSTYGLDNDIVDRTTTYGTTLLPELLNAGSLTDLRATIAYAKPIPLVQLGTSQLTYQVWLGSKAPPDAIARLEKAGLTVDLVTTRSGISEQLQRLAETSGLSGFLAVAVLAAILAIALLIGTSVAAVSRQRTETLALTTAGVNPSHVVLGHTVASVVRLVIAGATAFGCGIGTAHLSARLIPQAALGAIPKPLLPLPVGPALLAIVVTLLPAVLIEVVIASLAAKRADAATLRAALP